MIAYLFRTGSYAAMVFAAVTIYATDSLGSPLSRPLAGVAIAAFFIFWIVFATFGRRTYTRDQLRSEIAHGDGGSLPGGVNKWIRGDRRSDDGFGEHRESGGDGGGDGGGGGD